MITYCRYCGVKIVTEKHKRLDCSVEHRAEYYKITTAIQFQKRLEKTATMNKTQLRLESKNWRKIQNFLLR